MNRIRIAILDAATLGNDVDLSVFNQFGEVEIYDLTGADEIKKRISDCQVCVINKVKLNGEVLAHAKALKLICVAATGYDNIDTLYCREHSIALCNVAGYSVNSVSQLTVAMVLSASVNLDSFKLSVSSGRYSAGNVQNILTPVYHELAGQTWGIIGYGQIGRKVGDVAKALGCKVIVNKRTPIEGEECVSLDEILRRSDIITLHTPLSDETRGLIGENEIAKMKDGVVLINVARGAVTDESAVAEAVKKGKIGFFGCDVYSTEPMPASHPFYEIKDRENVCLTPHMAWGAFESRSRCIKEICLNIEAFFKGESRNRIV